MSTRPVGLFARLSHRGCREQTLARLQERRYSWYIKETAHAMEGSKCARRGRGIGVLVALLSAAMGTSGFLALGHNPSTAAKVAVGVMGVVAALAAAWRETEQYEKRSEGHEIAGSEYENIRYGAGALEDKLQTGLVTLEQAEDELEQLEDKAEDLAHKAPALNDRSILKAIDFDDGLSWRSPMAA